MELYENNFLLIDHPLLVIQFMLNTKKEFYPIATIRDSNGKILPFNCSNNIKQPNPEEMVLNFEKLLNEQLDNNEIHSYSIAVDTFTSKNSDTEKSNTIAIIIKSVAQSSGIIYYSYNFDKNKQFQITGEWEELC